MLIESESGIFTQADAQVFRLLMDGNRTERRLLAAGRMMDGARRRASAVARLRAVRDAREHARAAREVEREFGDAWGRTVRIRMPHDQKSGSVQNGADSKTSPAATTRSTTSKQSAKRTIRAYKAPLRDARGRIAVFFRVRYVGLKSKNWRPGISADHVLYILREEAQENGDVALGVLPVLSNMGETAEEIAACWRALEAMEQGYRANAKVQYRVIWNLPHGLGAHERRELVEDFCDRTFGRLGLPWVAAIHKADARGDQRNYHAHVCFSTRPCERAGDREWTIASEKVNGLTDENGLKRMRALVAGHMNIACQAVGLAARFTHQTYKERGIDAERQEHVGPQRMAAHERGEAVAVIERNARIAERNELAAARDHAARKLALTSGLAGLLRRRVMLAASQRRLLTVAGEVGAIAVRAKSLSTIVGPVPPAAAIRAVLSRVVDGARGISTTRAGQALARPLVRDRLSRIVDGAQILSGLQAGQNRDRIALTGMRVNLSARSDRVRARAVADTAQRQRAEALLLGAVAPPYVIRGTRAVLDLSAMNADDRGLVLTLDRDALGAALKERVRRDLDAAEAQARRQDERQRMAAERQRQIDDAVRILGKRQADTRKDDKRAQAVEPGHRRDAGDGRDWIVRASQVLANGPHRSPAAPEVRSPASGEAERLSPRAEAEPRMSPDVAARARSLATALDARTRMKTAHAAPDMSATTPAEPKPSGAAPNRGISSTVGSERTAMRCAMLARVAEQREALTRQHVVTRRTDDPPKPVGAGIDTTAPSPSPSNTAQHRARQAAGLEGQGR
jgi:hypothetical protein